MTFRRTLIDRALGTENMTNPLMFMVKTWYNTLIVMAKILVTPTKVMAQIVATLLMIMAKATTGHPIQLVFSPGLRPHPKDLLLL